MVIQIFSFMLTKNFFINFSYNFGSTGCNFLNHIFPCPFRPTLFQIVELCFSIQFYPTSINIFSTKFQFFTFLPKTFLTLLLSNFGSKKSPPFSFLFPINIFKHTHLADKLFILYQFCHWIRLLKNFVNWKNVWNNLPPDLNLTKCWLTSICFRRQLWSHHAALFWSSPISFSLLKSQDSKKINA